ncbi:ATP-binding cassette domain-containing protein [Flavobacterium selenitireducens]|uniref:ATP-binding cassette domain-containing protein n=1 Tax=Flavobacterium selenitireducens TaxID=2722704 RepID=UPI00168AF43B|nr:ATP-binding cassette domain-containing protein [Flavobacterium selenitireducens]MBD3582120.1 ATP-binding cassette domain-containing protein [Flavobacterium selenitireducens]
MQTHVLEIDSVRKSFSGKLVVSDVWLKIETGEIVGLLGRNGSGKSTLLKIISGNLRGEQQHLRIDGKLTSDAKNRIAYLNQDNFVPKQFSVKKAMLLSLGDDQVEAFCDDEMTRSILDRKISELSTGQRRYFEIRLLLFHPADFVLLDEPYNGLSPTLIEEVNALIRSRSKSKAIIVTDHNYRNIIDVSTRLVLMKEGTTHHLSNKSGLVEKGYLNEGML